jgi:hypothetical protein
MRYVIVIVLSGLQHVVESCLDSITVTSRGQVAIAVVRYDGTQQASGGYRRQARMLDGGYLFDENGRR